jgi:excisionase family DNA binding protein
VTYKGRRKPLPVELGKRGAAAYIGVTVAEFTKLHDRGLINYYITLENRIRYPVDFLNDYLRSIGKTPPVETNEPSAETKAKEQSENQISPLVPIREVSRLLHVDENTIRRWSDKGILKAYRIGPRGDRRFRSEDIEALRSHGNNKKSQEQK